MKKILLATAVASVASSALAEPLVITIYGYRTPSENVDLTYSGDVHYIADGEDISDVVSESSGVTLVSSGPKGQKGTVFMRGTDSNHTLVSLNGVPIKDESTPNGADDISQHSTVGITSVEVIKGPGGALYGPNAIAGVINLNTQPMTDRYVQLEHGSNNTMKQKIKLGGYTNQNKTVWSSEIERNDSDGISVYKNGTEPDPYKDLNYALSQETLLDNGYTLYTGLIHNHNKANLDSSSADVENYTSDWVWDNLNISLYDRETKVTFNRSTHDREYNNDGTLDKYKSTTNTVLTQRSFSFVDNMETTFGYEGSLTDSYIQTGINGGQYAYEMSVDTSRVNQGVFASNSYQLNKDIYLNGSIRYDVNNKFSDQTTGRIGVNAYGIKGAISRGYRIPSVYEMYGTDNYGYTGSSDLGPEKSTSWEIGYGNDYFDLTYFNIQTTNTIDYKYDSSTYTATYVNADGTHKSHGIELNTKYSYGMFKFNNSLTLNESTDEDGIQKLRRPQVMNTTRVIANVDDRTLVGTKVNYVGPQYDIHGSTYTRIKAESITTVDVFAEKHFGDRYQTKLYAGIDNLTDLDYERPSGYNQPGRTFKVGLKYNF